jgi:hypothetical protein
LSEARQNGFCDFRKRRSRHFSVSGPIRVILRPQRINENRRYHTRCYARGVRPRYILRSCRQSISSLSVEEKRSRQDMIEGEKTLSFPICSLLLTQRQALGKTN